MASSVHVMTRTYLERGNMIGWGKAGQFQMDQAADVCCLKFDFSLQSTSNMFPNATFSTVQVLYAAFWTFWRVHSI